MSIQPTSVPTSVPTLVGSPIHLGAYWSSVITMVVLLFGLMIFGRWLRTVKSVEQYRQTLSGKTKNYLKHLPDPEYASFLKRIHYDPYIGMSHEFNGDGKPEDFIRLVANDNSLISCFLVDPLNDYGAEYRINIYILTTAFGFIFFAVSAHLSSGEEIIYLINFVIFPCIIRLVNNLAYYVLVCPCFTNDCKNQSEIIQRMNESRKFITRLFDALISLIFIFAGSLVLSQIKHDQLKIVSYIISNFFLVSILVRSVAEVLFSALLFVDTTQCTLASRIARFANTMTCDYFRIGIWHRQKIKYNNQPRTFILEDGTELTSLKMTNDTTKNPMEDIVEMAKLDRRLSIEERDNVNVIPGFGVDRGNESSNVHSSIKTVPGFSFEEDAHYKVRNNEVMSSVVPGFRAEVANENKRDTDAT